MLSIIFINFFFWFLTVGRNFTPYKKNGTGGYQPVPTLNGKKKASNRSCSKLNFVQKSLRTCMIGMVAILYGTEIAKYIHLWLNAAKNTHYLKKKRTK